VCALVFLCAASTASAQQPYSTEEADVAKPRSLKMSVGAEFDALQPEDTDHDCQTRINAIVGHAIADKTKVAVNAGFMPSGNPSIGALGINAHRGKIVTFGGMLTREINDKLKLGGEINGAMTTTGDVQHQLHVLGGGNYELRRGTTIDAGVVVGHFTRTPRFGVMFGVTLTAPSTAAAE